MIRHIALATALITVAFGPVLAQTQAQTHPPHTQGKPHDPAAHPAMDPALHAALHARLVGNWSGTLTSADATAGKLQVAIANDKTGQLTLKLVADRSLKAGAASEVAVDSDGLHWTQALTGKPCKATASVEALAAHHGTDSMNGTMTCGQQKMTFALQKNHD